MLRKITSPCCKVNRVLRDIRFYVNSFYCFFLMFLRSYVCRKIFISGTQTPSLHTICHFNDTVSSFCTSAALFFFFFPFTFNTFGTTSTDTLKLRNVSQKTVGVTSECYDAKSLKESCTAEFGDRLRSVSQHITTSFMRRS